MGVNKTNFGVKLV